MIRVNDHTRLSILQHSDGEELFGLIKQNRAHLQRWLPWIGGIQSLEQVHSVIQMWVEKFHHYQEYHFGIFHKGALAGVISLHGVDVRNSLASLGYFLAKNMEGKGLIIESAKELINFAFLSLRLNRIEIRCRIDNLKSQAVPIKLGFKQEGTVRDGEYVNGRFHHLYIYGILQRDWVHFLPLK